MQKLKHVICATAAAKANQVLGQMSRALSYRDRVTWIRLYKIYVRHHLEYSVQSWSPWTDADRDVLEDVQKRVIRMTLGLSSLNYEDRLREVGLTTLQARRERGDMIQVWKYLNHKQAVDPSKLFTLQSDVATRVTRAAVAPLTLADQPFRGEIRRNFFTIRVIRAWNALPPHIRTADTINSFKNRYDKFLNK